MPPASGEPGGTGANAAERPWRPRFGPDLDPHVRTTAKGLLARTVAIRAGYHAVEENAVELLDEELLCRVAVARLALLDVNDRLAQLAADDERWLEEAVG